MKKKRNKSYDPSVAIKAQQRLHARQTEKLAGELTKDVAMIFTMGNKIGLIDHNTGYLVDFTQDHVRIFDQVPLNWSLYLIVFCVNSNGDTYAPLEEVVVKEPMKVEELNLQIVERHTELIRSARQADMVNIGWLAIPSGKTFSTEEVISKFVDCEPFTRHERGTVTLDIS